MLAESRFRLINTSKNVSAQFEFDCIAVVVDSKCKICVYDCLSSCIDFFFLCRLKN